MARSLGREEDARNRERVPAASQDGRRWAVAGRGDVLLRSINGVRRRRRSGRSTLQRSAAWRPREPGPAARCAGVRPTAERERRSILPPPVGWSGTAHRRARSLDCFRGCRARVRDRFHESNVPSRSFRCSRFRSPFPEFRSRRSKRSAPPAGRTVSAPRDPPGTRGGSASRGACTRASAVRRSVSLIPRPARAVHTTTDEAGGQIVRWSDGVVDQRRLRRRSGRRLGWEGRPARTRTGRPRRYRGWKENVSRATRSLLVR